MGRGQFHSGVNGLTGPVSQVTDRWCKWKCAFEYYAEGKGIENVCKKMSQPFLHFAGMEVQDIFEDLQDPGSIPEEGNNPYKVAICKLDFYFRVEEKYSLRAPCKTGRPLTSLWYA